MDLFCQLCAATLKHQNIKTQKLPQLLISRLVTLHTDSFLWSKLKQLLQKIWAELDCFQIPFFSSIKKAGPNKRLLWKTLLLTTLWCWWAGVTEILCLENRGWEKVTLCIRPIRINHPGYFKGIECPPIKSWFHSLNWKAWCCLADTLSYHGRIIKSLKKPQHMKPTEILGLQEIRVLERKKPTAPWFQELREKKVVYSYIFFQCALVWASCSSSCFYGSHSRTDHFNTPCSSVCSDS